MFTLIFILASCGQDTSPNSSNVDSSNIEISSDTQSSQTSQSTEQLESNENQDSSVPDDSEDLQEIEYLQISGIIFEGTEGLLCIKTANGQELEFDASGADITYIQGLRFGDPVTIFYVGIIDGTDTTNVDVKKLVQP